MHREFESNYRSILTWTYPGHIWGCHSLTRSHFLLEQKIATKRSIHERFLPCAIEKSKTTEVLWFTQSPWKNKNRGTDLKLMIC